MSDPARPGSAPMTQGALLQVQSAARKQVSFQYNPTTLRRSLRANTVGGTGANRSEAVRFSGAPVETISLDAQFDATSALDTGTAPATEIGIYPQLSALALFASPSTASVSQQASSISAGQIQVIPALAPQLLFVWGKQRVVPVRLATFEITEQFFDAALNPIRALVSLTLRVLSYSDVEPNNPAYHQFMTYQQGLEQMASRLPGKS